MNWNNKGNIITNTTVKNVQDILGVTFPEDFLSIMKKYDGGYPSPNKITIDNSIEVVNNLVSFMEDDLSYIIDIFYETEYLKEENLIPIAEDPFGNLYCYDFDFGKNEIVFWNHENPDDKRFICDSFTKFMQMLHD